MNRVEIKRKQIQGLSLMAGAVIILIMRSRISSLGMALFGAGFMCVALAGALFVKRVPDALGRVIRLRFARGQFLNVTVVKRSVLILQSVIGLLLGATLFLCSDILMDQIFHLPYGALSLKILSAVMVLQTLNSVFLGYFQGNGTQMPAVLVSALRQVFFLIFGLIFSGMFYRYGEKASLLLRSDVLPAMYGAAGLSAALLVTELLVLIFLLVVYLGSGKLEKLRSREGLKKTDTFFSSVKGLYASMGFWPVLDFSGVLSVALILVFFFGNVPDQGLAAWDLGAWLSGFLALLAIPVLWCSLLLLPCVLRVLSNLKKEEGRLARENLGIGIHGAFVHACFPAAYCAAMGSQLGVLFGGDRAEKLGLWLRTGAVLILLLPLSAYLLQLLMRMGRQLFALASAGCAALTLGLGSLLFVRVLQLQMTGVVLAGVAAGLVLLIVSALFVRKRFRIRIDVIGWVLVPVGAALLSGALCFLLGSLLTGLIGPVWVLLLSAVTGGGLYIALMALLRNIRGQELAAFPAGGLILRIGALFHISF